ncbi:MAG: hypothetical protein ACKV2O_25440 [Acidimicrobiales bacterium]
MAGSAPTTSFRRARLPLIVAAAGLMLASCAAGDGGADAQARNGTGESTAITPFATSPTGPLPAIEPADLKTGFTVVLAPQGEVLNGQVSLTLCGAYRTEPYRTQRRSMVVADAAGEPIIAAESVRYQTEKYAMLSMADLRSRIKECPDTFVTHPVEGRPALRFEFFEPDKSKWPAPPTGVDRVATAFRATDESGGSSMRISVFQQAGDTLVAVHTTVDAKLGDVLVPEIATIAGLTDTMAKRLQAAP